MLYALPGLNRARDQLKLSQSLKRRLRHWDTLLRDDPGELGATVHARRRVEVRVGKGCNRALAAKVARATKAARAARLERAGVSLGVVKGGEEAEVAKAASTAAIVAAREAAEAVAKAGMGTNKA
jgi:hypothetical protein